MFNIKWKLEKEANDDGGQAGGGVQGSDAGNGQGGDKGSDKGAVPALKQGEDKTVEQKSAWPENWRELYAGNDDKKLQRLSRYASPQAAFDAMIAAQNKISSGELKPNTPFPEKGTDEEKAAWRAEHGIPASPDKYDLKFDDIAIDDEDKPIIDELLKAAHNAHYTPEQAKTAIKWYYDQKDAEAEQRQTLDKQIAQETQDALRAEWGPEYRRNINLINGLLDTGPAGVKDKLLGGRLADGTPIGSDPDVIKFLIDIALQINPVTTLVPNAGGNISGAIDDEIRKLEGMMGDRSSEYWKGPYAEKNQARLRELYSARERLNPKKSAA